MELYDKYGIKHSTEHCAGQEEELCGFVVVAVGFEGSLQCLHYFHIDWLMRMPHPPSPNGYTCICTAIPTNLRLSSLIIGIRIHVLQSATSNANCRTANSSGTTRPATRGGSSPARTSPCPTSTLCATRTPTSTSLKKEEEEISARALPFDQISM